MPRQSRSNRDDSNVRDFLSTVRDHPYASAAAAAGAAGVAAASAFLWSRRGQIGETLSSGMDRFSEMKAERFGSARPQSEIAEEAATLKQTGKQSKGPRGPIAQQELKAGLAGTKTSNQELKAGAKAFS